MGDGKKITFSTERSTSNVQWEKMKKQQERPYLIIGATGNLRKDNFLRQQLMGVPNLHKMMPTKFLPVSGTPSLFICRLKLFSKGKLRD